MTDFHDEVASDLSAAALAMKRAASELDSADAMRRGSLRRRRARQRKWIVSGTVAIALVVVFLVPLPGWHLFRSVTPETAPHHPTTTSPRTTPPKGGAVPSGFVPESVSFVSPSTGFALGVEPCRKGTCTTVVRTLDGGSSWVSLPVTPGTYVVPGGLTVPADGSAEISEVRFADAADGWLFGPALFATHDGGRTWRRLEPGGAVVALETSGGYVDAVVSPCSIGSVCDGRLRLEQAGVRGGAFTTVVSGPLGRTNAAFAAISLHAPVGFVALGSALGSGTTRLYRTGNLGNPRSWTSFADPCPSSRGLSLTSLVAPDATTLYSLCTGKTAAGSSAKLVVVIRNGVSAAPGSAPLGGSGGALGATSSGTLVVASASGASFLYRSTDGGRSWNTAMAFSDGGEGFDDLAFVNVKVGVVIHFVRRTPTSQAGQLLMTRDAGANWESVAIG